MDNEKVFAMSFGKVYPMLIAKAERKGRTKEDVLAVTSWLTGYTPEEIQTQMASAVSYGDFFRKAPNLNPNRKLITGSICGIKLPFITLTCFKPILKEVPERTFSIGIQPCSTVCYLSLMKS